MTTQIQVKVPLKTVAGILRQNISTDANLEAAVKRHAIALVQCEGSISAVIENIIKIDRKVQNQLGKYIYPLFPNLAAFSVCTVDSVDEAGKTLTATLKQPQEPKPTKAGKVEEVPLETKPEEAAQ